MEDFVVVLDLDGVVIKSNLVKYRAMLSLFSEYDTLQQRIGEHILARGGVPRRDKIAGILTNIVETGADEAVLTRYLERYAVALGCELAAAPLVDGVGSFLAESGYQFYLSSSAPEAEVHDQLARRNLLERFSAVYGIRTPKQEALRRVRQAHPSAAIVFFGDSQGDLEAARDADVAFVAVTCERDNFGGQNLVKLADFASPEVVQNCMRTAVRQHAT